MRVGVSNNPGAWWLSGRVRCLPFVYGRRFESHSSRPVYRDLGQVLHLQFHLALNSDTSLSGPERLSCEKRYVNE